MLNDQRLLHGTDAMSPASTLSPAFTVGNKLPFLITL